MSKLITLLGRVGTVLVSFGLAAAIIYELPSLIAAEDSRTRLLTAIEITIPIGLLLAASWFLAYLKQRRKPTHSLM